MTPAAEALFDAMDATWPAHRVMPCDGWLIRDGSGGGKRVSAASAVADSPDIDAAIAAMRAIGQTPLFMLRDGGGALDAALAARGFDLLDPSLIYLAPASTLAQKPPHVSLFPVWPPLAIMRDIWAEGGIGPARLQVMPRACQPLTGFAARHDDRAAGAGFCAVAGPIAMLHAIEIVPGQRRRGVAENMLRGAAHWAREHGADWLALAVTEANAPARALYEKLGMQVAARYHYRQGIEGGEE
ncbi:MAG: GNAT family N-acetyltransferase [Rhodobacteraceae bacterium]|nr:GNAT family N-acetyltransferase [Paracoccaceae bacterium]